MNWDSRYASEHTAAWRPQLPTAPTIGHLYEEHLRYWTHHNALLGQFGAQEDRMHQRAVNSHARVLEYLNTLTSRGTNQPSPPSAVALSQWAKSHTINPQRATSYTEPWPSWRSRPVTTFPQTVPVVPTPAPAAATPTVGPEPLPPTQSRIQKLRSGLQSLTRRSNAHYATEGWGQLSRTEVEGTGGWGAKLEQRNARYCGLCDHEFKSGERRHQHPVHGTVCQDCQEYQ